MVWRQAHSVARATGRPAQEAESVRDASCAATRERELLQALQLIHI